MPDCPFEKEPPALMDAEMSEIPGADVASGKLEALKLVVCVRQNNKIAIHTDARREWTSTEDAYSKKFAELDLKHAEHYMNMLTTLLDAPLNKSPGKVRLGAIEVPEDEGEDSCSGSAGGEEVESLE